MAISDISLTAGMRANLTGLQNTVTLLNRTQGRLSSGKKVNSALDNPINFFTAQAHMSRASDLSSLKDAMTESVQTIQAANNGITSISSLINQAKALGQAAEGADPNQVKIQFTGITSGETVVVGGSTYTAALSTGDANYTAGTSFIVTSDVQTSVSNLAALINAKKETSDMKAIATGSTLALSVKSTSEAMTDGNVTNYVDVTGVTANAPTTLLDTNGSTVFSDRAKLGMQYNDLMAQIDSIANSSGYQGTNLLMKDDLNVRFEGSALTVKGFSATASDLGLNTSATTTTSGDNWGWSVNSEISADLGKLDVATSTLRSQSSNLSNNLSIVNTQSDFMGTMINTLTTGADNLTLADMNEEGANMLMLQTRQSLGTTALSLSSQAAQSVLRLFA